MKNKMNQKGITIYIFFACLLVVSMLSSCTQPAQPKKKRIVSSPVSNIQQECTQDKVSTCSVLNGSGESIQACVNGQLQLPSSCVAKTCDMGFTLIANACVLDELDPPEMTHAQVRLHNGQEFIQCEGQGSLIDVEVNGTRTSLSLEASNAYTSDEPILEVNPAQSRQLRIRCAGYNWITTTITGISVNAPYSRVNAVNHAGLGDDVVVLTRVEEPPVIVCPVAIRSNLFSHQYATNYNNDCMKPVYAIDNDVNTFYSSLPLTTENNIPIGQGAIGIAVNLSQAATLAKVVLTARKTPEGQILGFPQTYRVQLNAEGSWIFISGEFNTQPNDQGVVELDVPSEFAGKNISAFKIFPVKLSGQAATGEHSTLYYFQLAEIGYVIDNDLPPSVADLKFEVIEVKDEKLVCESVCFNKELAIDEQDGTFYSSVQKSSRDPNGDFLAAWFSQDHTETVEVSKIVLTARSINGQNLGFPVWYRVAVHFEGDSGWSFIGGQSKGSEEHLQNIHDQLPDSSGKVRVNLPSEFSGRKIHGAMIVPVVFGVDDGNHFYFQLAEISVEQ